jgi:hypothetical protein
MSSDSEGRDGGGRERERERHTDRQGEADRQTELENTIQPEPTAGLGPNPVSPGTGVDKPWQSPGGGTGLGTRRPVQAGHVTHSCPLGNFSTDVCVPRTDRSLSPWCRQCWPGRFHRGDIHATQN